MSSEEASKAAAALGRIRTAKKAASSRENGKLGGNRPHTEESRQKISEGNKAAWAARKAAKVQPTLDIVEG